MRHTLRVCLALCITTALFGCAKKQDQTASNAGEDSLIASNVVEPPSGNMTPQQPYVAPDPVQQQTPAPKPHSATHAPAPAATSRQTPQHATSTSGSSSHTPLGPAVVVEYGSFMHVTVSNAMSSESLHAGDAWTGTLHEDVTVGSNVAFPAGSVVHGTVKDVKPAKAGDRALLALELESVDAFGNTYPVSASMEPIVPGSPRTRNVGAIIGGAAAGALIGSAVGGGKGAAVGGAIGGAAAGGAVAHSKGYEATLKSGDVVTFTVDKNVAVRKPLTVP